jgi:hypothetical protein
MAYIPLPAFRWSHMVSYYRWAYKFFQPTDGLKDLSSLQTFLQASSSLQMVFQPTDGVTDNYQHTDSLIYFFSPPDGLTDIFWSYRPFPAYR